MAKPLEGLAEYHVEIGRAQLALGQMDPALRSADPAAIRGKVAAMVAQRRTDDAVQFLQSLLKQDARNPSLVTLLGDVYLLEASA